MAMRPHPLHLALRRALALGPAMLLACDLPAAPGALSDVPLFLTINAEANVLFVIDDSGSMDWEVMTRDLVEGGLFTGSQPDGSSPVEAGSVKHRDSDEDGDADCSFDSGTYYGYLYGVEFASNNYTDNSYDCNTADDEAWRFRNPSFNPLYFDPTLDYPPWPGLRADGTPLGDIDLNNAPNNPYAPSEFIDLAIHNSNWAGGSARATGNRDGSPDGYDGFRFYTWRDLDGDGLYDNGEETEYLIADLTDAQAATWGRTAAEVRQNFANWFAYYRSRALVAKAAYGRVIAEAGGVRMGLVTLNNNNAVNTPIRSMNPDPATGNKKTLLDALYGLQPNGSTPLRSTYFNAGRYLECQDNSFGFAICPALPEANGGQCQQNYAVVMTDGFYNASFEMPGTDNRDGDNDSDWDSGPEGPFGDGHGNTLGDIAMYFYERDLSPMLDDVPTKPGVDENPAQHMVSYTISFGVDGSLTMSPADWVTPFSWPDPASADAHKIDDLRHAAFNGRGEYLGAQNPQQLIDAINDSISSIRARTGSAASVAFNSSTLSTNSQVYLALFNSSRWNGDLTAYGLDPISGEVSASPDWSAAGMLDSRNLTTSPRTILSYSETSGDGIALQWDQLDPGQQADLRTAPDGSTDTTASGQARLAWLRGERSCEQGGSGSCSHSDGGNTFDTKTLRARDSRMGDFIHSSPVYVGIPELDWPDNAPFPDGVTGTPYSEFRIAQGNRSGTVYIGGNDGMLHGFREADGVEVMAYVPRTLFSTSTDQGLHYLSDPGYSHRYYVDLRPTIVDAYIRTEPAGSRAWRTVLLGGLRGGGRGFYALDVTNPGAYSESGTQPAQTVLWEFNAGDDLDLGYSFSRPSIAMLNNGEWAAVFGNGYNDAGSGSAQLFIVFLEQGLDGSWTPGSDYLKLDTGIGDGSDRNGLSSPALVDLDGNGTADRVYAGDLTGRMWAFDLSSANTSHWDIAHKSGNTPEPLFVGPSPAQPITSLPVIVRHPSEESANTNQPNLLVLFGTGQYLTAADPANQDLQSFYGIWDHGNDSIARADLTEQSLSIIVSDGQNARMASDNLVDWDSADGWYLDLNDPRGGERMVVDPVVRGDRVFFNTTVPNDNPCDSGGTGWLITVDFANGGRPDAPVFDFNGDGLVSLADLVGGNAPSGREFNGGLPTNSVFLGNNRYTSGTDIEHGLALEELGHDAVEDLQGDDSGRAGWEELIP